VTEPAGETGAHDVPKITAPVGCAMNWLRRELTLRVVNWLCHEYAAAARYDGGATSSKNSDFQPHQKMVYQNRRFFVYISYNRLNFDRKIWKRGILTLRRL